MAYAYNAAINGCAERSFALVQYAAHRLSWWCRQTLHAFGNSGLGLLGPTLKVPVQMPNFRVNSIRFFGWEGVAGVLSTLV